MKFSKLTKKNISDISSVLEFCSLWYPPRLTEETGISAERVKYICKLSTEFVSLSVSEKKDSLSIEEFIQKFNKFILDNEYDLIRSLLPKPQKGNCFDFIDLFAGIGGMRKPFSKIGGNCVLTCEWNKYAKNTYKANWSDSDSHKFVSNIKSITQPIRDKNKLTGIQQVKFISKEVPDHDLLLAGFPCQPFSIAGVSKKNSLQRDHGFKCEDQGQLFFDVCRIMAVKQPPIVILENVKNLKSHDQGNTFKTIKDVITNLERQNELLFNNKIDQKISSYWIANIDENKPDPKIIDAAKFLPQHRERIVLICIRKDIVEKLNLDLKIDLKNINFPKKRITLEEILFKNIDVPSSYTLSDKLWRYLKKYAKKHKDKGNGFGYGTVARNKEDTARTLSARYYKDGSEILISQEDLKFNPCIQGRPRKLMPEECARLMGISSDKDKFNIPVSNTQAYKQFGNSVVVPVFDQVAKLVGPYIKEIKNLDK